MITVDTISSYLEKEEKAEMFIQVQSRQSDQNKLKGKTPSKSYQLLGWYQLPKDLLEREYRVRGNYLYYTETNGVNIRFTLN